MIKFFSEIKENEYEIAGGKGQSLSKMIKAGFNVPNGLVVGADVFTQSIKQNKINIEIENIIKSCDVANMQQIETASKLIKEKILSMKIDNVLENEIVNKFKQLKSEFVAVRSSATVEDGQTNAWAGQLDTFLFIDENSLIDSIKKCWASLFGTRAIYYRLKNNFSQEISVAVVVQQMIGSDFSGVAFSNDPTGGGGVIIECVEGLGEAIVSGSVTPDRYTIKNNKVDVKIASQTKKLIYSNNKQLTYVPVVNNSQKLSDLNIKKLAKSIELIKNFYGFEVDIEWCLKNNEIYILQCRPITTLNNNKMQIVADNILKSDNWEFYVKRPFHWLLESTQILAGSEEEQNKYLGFNIALQNYLILNGDEYFSLNEDNKNKKILKDLYDNNKNFFDDYANTLFNIVKDNLEYVDKLTSQNYKDLNNAELLQKYIEFKLNYIKSVVPTFARPDFFLESEFMHILKRDYNFNDDICNEIFASVATCSNNYGPLFYSEEPVDLLKIAKAKINGEDIRSKLTQHYNTYSWLKAPVIEKTTRFSIDDYMLRIESLIKQGRVDEKIKNVENARKQNDKMFENIISKYNICGECLKMANTIRTYIFLRTYMTEHTDHLFFNARTTILTEISRRFNISETDLVMLSLDEIEKVVAGELLVDNKLDRLVNLRRKGFAMVWLNKKCETYFGEDAVELQNIVSVKLLSSENDDNNGEKLIKGDIANKGKVTGRAKVVLSYNDVSKVEEGDILVASMTTPDYVAAMEKAIGFVTDEGGITCHAAIISREFSIPCIVGTVNGTKVIKDGDMIELDAYNGIVKILN